MALTDESPALIVRLSIALECPTCRAIPSTEVMGAAFGREWERPVLECATCGQVHQKQLWVRFIPDAQLRRE